MFRELLSAASDDKMVEVIFLVNECLAVNDVHLHPLSYQREVENKVHVRSDLEGESLDPEPWDFCTSPGLYMAICGRSFSIKSPTGSTVDIRMEQ